MLRCATYISHIKREEQLVYVNQKPCSCFRDGSNPITCSPDPSPAPSVNHTKVRVVHLVHASHPFSLRNSGFARHPPWQRQAITLLSNPRGWNCLWLAEQLRSISRGQGPAGHARQSGKRNRQGTLSITQKLWTELLPFAP